MRACIRVLKTITATKQKKAGLHCLPVFTTDKVGSVDIRGLKGYNGEIVSAVVETFKYMTKLDWYTIPNQQLQEMFKVTSNRRVYRHGSLFAKLS